MQNRVAMSAFARDAHQEEEDLAPDAMRAKVRHHRHPADLDRVVMRDETATPDWLAIEDRERMKRVRVVVIHFDFLGDVLLLDENAASNLMRMLHLLGAF